MHDKCIHNYLYNQVIITTHYSKYKTKLMALNDLYVVFPLTIGPYVKHITGKGSGRTKHGHIHSPNFPSDYESNTDFIWKIKVPENTVLRLTFGEFDTECSHDYLEIHHLNTADGTIKRFAQINNSCLEATTCILLQS